VSQMFYSGLVWDAGVVIARARGRRMTSNGVGWEIGRNWTGSQGIWSRKTIKRVVGKRGAFDRSRQEAFRNDWGFGAKNNNKSANYGERRLLCKFGFPLHSLVDLVCSF
jgi:hypothetical protein